MNGLVDANLPAGHTQRGRQVHSIMGPNLQHFSPNSPANGLLSRSSQYRAPHPALPTLGLGVRDGTAKLGGRDIQ